ncbi:hypothetical protein AAMO2058_000879700 [Amorphochlora amoebiformis]
MRLRVRSGDGKGITSPTGRSNRVIQWFPRSTIVMAIFVGMYVGWAAFTIRHYRAVTSIEATKTPIHIKDAKEPVENKSVGSGGEGGKREAECVSWTLKLKGHKYTHEWGEVSYDGLKSDEFATITVIAGAKDDPREGKCNAFNFDQALLVTKTGYLAAILSCSNQEIDIVEKSYTRRDCKGSIDKKKIGGITGPFTADQKGPNDCTHLFDCGTCVMHGSADTDAKKSLNGLDPHTKCVWCPKSSECRPYQDSSGQFPCDACIGNGDGYPGGDTCPAAEDEKYLTFAWNNGRVNNNMVSWAAAMAMGKHLDRVVVITQPIMKYSNGKGIHSGDPNFGKSAFLGILEGMWDLEYLRDNGFKIALETALPEEIMKKASYDTPARCRIGGNSFPKKEKYEDCSMVFMSNPFKFKSLKAQRPKEFIRPAKWLRDASEDIIKKKLGVLDKIEVSVHQRHHNWGHKKEHGSKFLCRGKLKNIFDSIIGKEYRDAVNKWTHNEEEKHRMLAFTQLSCAINWDEATRVLKYWKKVVIEKKDYEHLPQILEAYSRHKKLSFNCKNRYCAPRKKFDQLTGVYLDMWGMTMGKWFMGGYYSTMSDTICFWRGWNRMNDSNICFLPTRLENKWVRPGIDVAWGPPMIDYTTRE